MKKILTLMTLIMAFATQLSAQSEHFTFRDIPITGTVEEFGERLKELGYTPTGIPTQYKGKFIGEDCILSVSSSEYTGLVYYVAVQFETTNSWISLKSNYSAIQELCTSKYGKPLLSLRSFDSPYYEGDGYEISAIKLGKCTYADIWEVDNGKIRMGIPQNCSIILFYADKINEDLHEQAKRESAESEI